MNYDISLKIEKYIAFLDPKEILKASYRKALVAYKEYLEASGITEPNRNVILTYKEFLVKRRLSSSSIQKALMVLCGFYDEYISKLDIGMFDFFRDRQITNKFLKNYEAILVLRSRNILDNATTMDKEGYDKYIDSVEGLCCSYSCRIAFNYVPWD